MFFLQLIVSILIIALGLSCFVMPLFIGKITDNAFVGFVLFFSYMALVLFIIRKAVPFAVG